MFARKFLLKNCLQFEESFEFISGCPARQTLYVDHLKLKRS